MSIIKINGSEYPLPTGATAAETFESLQEIMPELKGKAIEPDGDNWRLAQTIGRKG